MEWVWRVILSQRADIVHRWQFKDLVGVLTDPLKDAGTPVPSIHRDHPNLQKMCGSDGNSYHVIGAVADQLLYYKH